METFNSVKTVSPRSTGPIEFTHQVNKRLNRQVERNNFVYSTGCYLTRRQKAHLREMKSSSMEAVFLNMNLPFFFSLEREIVRPKKISRSVKSVPLSNAFSALQVEEAELELVDSPKRVRFARRPRPEVGLFANMTEEEIWDSLDGEISYFHTPELPSSFMASVFPSPALISEKIIELYHSDRLFFEFIERNRGSTYTVTTRPGSSNFWTDCAWKTVFDDPPEFKFRRVHPPRSYPLKKIQLNMVKLGNVRVNRRNFYREFTIREKIERENVFYSSQLPFFSDDYQEEGGYEMRGNRFDFLFDLVKREQVVSLMDRSEYFCKVQFSVNSSDFKILESYLRKLYKNVQFSKFLEVLDSLYYSDDDKLAKMCRRRNSKYIETLDTHINNFINHSPPGNFEEQVGGFCQAYQSVVSGCGRVDEITSKFSSVLDSFKTTVETSTATLEKTSETMSKAQEVFEPLGSSFVQSKPVIEDLLHHAKVNAPLLIAHFMNMFRFKNFSDWSLSLLSICGLLGLGDYAYNKIMSVFQGFTQQGQNTFKLLALVSTFLGDYSPTKILGMSSAFSTIREMKAITELCDLLEGVAKEWGILESPEVELANTLKSDVGELLEKYVRFQSMQVVNPSKFLFTTTYSEFKQSFDRLLEIEKQLMQKAIPQIAGTTLVAEVAKLRDNYIKLNDIIQSIRRGTSIRQETVGICFVGAPGVGKSKLTLDLSSNMPNKKSKLVERFLARKFDEKDSWIDNDVRNWQVWNESMSAGSQFSDGYCGQDIHVVDDIFQSADDSEHVKWANYISPAKYLTNQAALESKGLPYTCKVALTSANKFPRTSKKMNEVQALHRRFTVVDVKSIRPASDNYDPNFSHLIFRIFPTGVDYINNVNGIDVDYDELTDYILDRIHQKYNAFCQETGYAEQDAPETEEVSIEEFIRLARHATPLNNIADIRYTRISGSPFHRIIFNPIYSREYFPLEPSNKYLEILKHYPDMVNPRLLFNHIDAWLPWSSQAVDKFDNHIWLNLSPNSRSYLFLHNDGNPKCVSMQNSVLPSAEMNQDFVKFYHDKVLDRFSENVQEETQDTFYSAMYAKFVFLKNYILDAWEYTKGKMGAFSKLSIVQSIITWLTPKSSLFDTVFNSIIRLASNKVIDFIVACSVLCVYMRVMKFVYGNNTCNKCSSSNNSALKQQLESLRETFCKDHCNIGILYTNHIEECKIFPEHIQNVLGITCAECSGECQSDCNHTVGSDNRSVHFVHGVLKQYGAASAASFKDLLSTNGYEFEGSDESRRNKAKSRFNFESSSESRTNKKKTNFKFESSSESKKTKAKFAMNFEASEGQPKSKETIVSERPIFDFAADEIFSDNADYNEEAQSDPAAYELSSSIMKCVTKCWSQSNFGNLMLKGLGYGAYIITPAHLVRDGTDHFALDAAQVATKLSLITHNKVRDVALWRMENTASKFNLSLLRHVVTNADLSDRVRDNKGAILCVPRREGLHILHAAMLYHKYEKISVHSELRQYESVFHVTGLKYDSVGTARGDCGSPLIMLNPNCQRKLVGFHILGSALQKDAYAACITKEFLEEMIAHDQFSEEASFDLKMEVIECDSSLPVVDVMNLVSTETPNTRLASEGDISYVGEFSYTSVPAKDTSLIKHRLFGTFPVTSEPAALQEADVEDKSKLHLNNWGNPDILQTQLNKYKDVQTTVENLDEDLIDMTEQLSDYFISVLGDLDLSPMTETEALSGINNKEDSNPLDMRTTAGEPFARLGREPGKKKSSFVNIDRDPVTGRKLYSFNRETEHARYLCEVIDLKERLALSGYRTLSLWKNCLKDETRPLEKIKVGKTRLFTAAPFDTVFLGRKYFGKFKEEWQRNRDKLFHSVGVNPVSAEWTNLANSLLEKGDNFYDADYSSYDGRLRSDFMYAAGQIVINTICERNNVSRTLLETIWQEFIETFQVGFRTVHLVKHGNPSGNPMTTVVNCIVNFLYHWYAYRKITGYVSLSHFTSRVGFTCFGDDVLYSTTKDSGYTFNKVSSLLHELGQEYTTAAKDSTSADSRTISEVTFLKRRFVKENSIYLAPLDTDSIEQQFNYTYVGENDFCTIQQQLQEACMEAALHNATYYKSFAAKVNTSLARDSDLHHYIQCLPVYKDARGDVLKRVLELSA